LALEVFFTTLEKLGQSAKRSSAVPGQGGRGGEGGEEGATVADVYLPSASDEKSKFSTC